MAKDETKDLLKFLKPFPDQAETVLWLREFVWDMYPQVNELIYDNYNALAFGWSPTDKVGHTFCSIAVGRTSKNIHFGFYWGSELSDPEKKLNGEGNQYRYVLERLKGFSESLHQEANQRSIPEFACQGEGHKANQRRADYCKVYFAC